ncbi:response regulator transcription factor [Paenibacillus sp. J5C_2022]|uniref:response regulator transcription factor n=1 Tax=Paenibacillus sp. J5C2022 TaxID=2977129 RepID=UPI0021CE1612|nr:response regulator transcription factor [Paenibacillus sp. J5C2022]MCU6712914.1 response regulator transcription factor [Paenibacillus sp. J5C2022]
MHILLAEDDLRLGPLIVHMLGKEGHAVDWVKDGIEALDYMETTSYDLVILDWMMPRMDGVTLCRRIRMDSYSGGIIILTAKDTLNDRIHGLDAGADDYIMKPFEFTELFARIRSLSRRIAQVIQDEWIEMGSYQLLVNERSLACRDKKLGLTIREFQLIELLMRNCGKVLPRQVLIDRIWGFDTDVNSNTLDALVKQLRKKLECTTGGMRINNIRGTGYKLEVADVCSDE